MKNLFLIITIGVMIMTNVNAQDLSKLTPWKDKYAWLNSQEDVELTLLKTREYYVRLYKKDAVSQGGYLPDEISISFEDVISYRQIPLSEANDLVKMAKENNHYYYITTPSASLYEDGNNLFDTEGIIEPTFSDEYYPDDDLKEYIIIGKENVFHFITDKEPFIVHEYGIMDRVPDDMLEEMKVKIEVKKDSVQKNKDLTVDSEGMPLPEM